MVNDSRTTPRMGNALEELVRNAMCAGFACIAERVGRGEVSRNTSLMEVLDDFPQEFLTIRSGLVEDLRAEWGVE